MTIEERLKNLILTKYRSVREFTQSIDMPYSTFSTIINRGIDNANVTNVIRICKALGISADALADGRIVYVSHVDPETETALDIDHALSDIKTRVLTYDNLTLKGKPIDRDGRLLIADYLDVTIELVNRQLNGDRLKRYVDQLSKKQ